MGRKLQAAIKMEQNVDFLTIRNQFIDKFTLCDLTCKVVLEQYQKMRKRNGEEIKLVLDMRTIPHAFAWAEIDVDRHILSSIFGGSKGFKKKGSKSAKKLRDGILHAMNADDLQELLERQNTLMAAMDTYLALFLPPDDLAEQIAQQECALAGSI